MLKVGDYVAVKEGTILENGEVVNNFGGKIILAGTDGDSFLVKFDAPTLGLLSDIYIKGCLNEGHECYAYGLDANKLEKSSRRNTDREYWAAAVNLEERRWELKLATGMELGEYEHLERKSKIWYNGFEESEFVDELEELEKRSVPFIIQTFFDYCVNHMGATTPDLLTTADLREICLELVPRKVSSVDNVFDYYGKVLIYFMKYFEGLENSLPTLALQKCLVDIKDQIPVLASDRNNWGMAKTTTMDAVAAGVDPTDIKQIMEFSKNYKKNTNLNNILNSDEIIIKRIMNPFKNIGRNDRVTVKFTNGDVLENIKFKKVQVDLKEGRCELLEK